jgi:hypothetical protein
MAATLGFGQRRGSAHTGRRPHNSNSNALSAKDMEGGRNQSRLLVTYPFPGIATLPHSKRILERLCYNP